MTNAAYTPPPFPCSIVVIQTTGQLGKTFKFERKDWCVLGANKDCDIIVPFPDVAPLQALIHVKSNGVFLQGIDKHLPVRHLRAQKQLINEEEALLLPGDMFLLGERKFLIEYSAEDAIIEASNAKESSVQEPSTSKIASKSLRTAVTQSKGTQKKRRKSSLVVGEFDEKYVAPRVGSERLLSKSQLARISQSELDIIPVGKGDADRNLNDRESTSPRKISEESLQEVEDFSCSSSSDESTVLSDHHHNLSRKIDFSSIGEDHPVTECSGNQRDPPISGPHKTLSSRQRRDLVFTRLSKGLSATPRKGESNSLVGSTNAVVHKPLGSSHVEETMTGKENVPQLFDQVSKSFNPKESKEGESFNRIRSPLANRAELENQVELTLIQKGTPPSKSHAGLARPSNRSAQTPRGRSVAFASAIELAAGAHYSPYRPKQVATVSRSTSKSEETKQSKKLAGSAKTRGVRSRFPVGSPSHRQMQTPLTKDDEQVPALVSSLEGLGTFYYSKPLPRDASKHHTQPVVEYEDDSDPPTPSSTEAPESMVLQVPGPSPMARVGGALAAFLKRLSGTLESEEDDSCSETDGAGADKRSSTKSQDKLPGKVLSSSEPVMSSNDLMGLARSLSPEHRRQLVAQVEDAARDMRQALHLVSENSTEERLCSSEEILEIAKMTSEGLDKVANHPTLLHQATSSVDPVVSAEGCDTQQLLKGCGPDSNDATTAEDKSTSPISAMKAEDPLGSAGDIPPLSGTEKEFEESCASPEAYNRSSRIYICNQEHMDWEIEEMCSSGTNGSHQPDLQSEDSEGKEIDYGDEDDDTSMESDREIAAVVVDDNVDQVLLVPYGVDIGSHRNDAGVQEQGKERQQAFEDASTTETTMERSLSLEVLPDIKRDATERGGGVDERLCNESDKISSDSTAPSDGMSNELQKVTVSDMVAGNSVGTNSLITSEADESRKITHANCNKDREEDISRKDQDSIPRATFELEEKPSQLAALERELARLKKDELKARLLQRELDANGLKKDLVERLALHMTNETSAGNRPASEQSGMPPRQTNEDQTPALTSTFESRASQATPRVLRTRLVSAKDDSTISEDQTMPRRSGRKTRVKSPLEIDVPKSSAKDTSEIVARSRTADEAETGPDLSLYRRRTVKELRQFLMVRDLDVQQRMRKEELIQHVVSLGIGSDGQNLPVSTERDVPKLVETKPLHSGEAEGPLSGATTKPQHRITVTQLRSQLKERGQCQAGTKKTLLERLSLRPERRTRSKRTVEETSCFSCQAGKICEAEGKR